MEDLLSIGSVVSLKNHEHKVMVTGLMQVEVHEDKKIMWDYCGCFYPIGMQDSKRFIMFNEEHIERIFAIGYQDEEQLAFMNKVNSYRAQFKANMSSNKDDEKSEE